MWLRRSGEEAGLVFDLKPLLNKKAAVKKGLLLCLCAKSPIGTDSNSFFLTVDNRQETFGDPSGP